MIVVLASAKGSPGVTTALLALTGMWPRPVLMAECDPNGADLAARFGLPPNPGLVSLASAARHGLGPRQLREHMQRLPGGIPVLLGVQLPEQALALGPLWSRLAAELARLEVDVLVDGGQLVGDSPVLELVAGADLLVLVGRPTVEGVTHLAGRIARLEQQGQRPVVVLVGDRPYGPRAVEETLRAEGLRAPVLGVLADDPRAAAALSGESGRPSLLARSLLVRSAREIALRIESHVEPRRGSGRTVATEAPTAQGRGGRGWHG
jgi:MinD-like ATPase involved in chromosome partitioning or flagellar assembly